MYPGEFTVPVAAGLVESGPAYTVVRVTLDENGRVESIEAGSAELTPEHLAAAKVALSETPLTKIEFADDAARRMADVRVRFVTSGQGTR